MASKKVKPAAAQPVEAGANQFVLEGKKYNVVKGAIVPLADGIEKLTPADICVHQEAQIHLVEVGASCIEEVTE